MNPSLHIKLYKFNINSFHFFSVVGYTSGVILSLVLAYLTRIPLWPYILCAIVGTGIFLLMAYLYKRITGNDDLVYYQQEIAVLLTCSLLLWVLNQPILVYLDLTLLTIGVILFFGRMGCFSVGCCHGKPCKHGVIYSHAHVKEGFPFYYQGIRMFPVPLVESFVALIITGLCTYLILTKSEHGTMLLVYSVIYGFIRFTLEFFRGDPERPYWLDFSEAQWTTLGIFLVSLLLSYYGILPYYSWHIWIVIALCIFMLTTIIYYQLQSVPTYKIWRQRHIFELANRINSLDRHHELDDDELLIIHTSLGLKVSKGVHNDEGNITEYYTISKGKLKGKIPLNMKSIKEIGRLIQMLRHKSQQMEIIEQESGVYHILYSNKLVKEKTTLGL